uniref:Uncharacterized protein n=1 Tax=Lactuca sativa TaxID=4236 RepID=A0A9R1W0A8_LACSA|nr:hypothetical protein LSAT_V11C400178590 [Lactuca sativa]
MIADVRIECDLLVNVADTQLKIVYDIAWSTSEMLVNKTLNKSNSGTRMGSNRGSPQIHADDITTTSVYRPQSEENHNLYHHEINEHIQGGLLDMLI